jgi:hypothetical protein
MQQRGLSLPKIPYNEGGTSSDPEFSHVTMLPASPYVVDFEVERSFREPQLHHRYNRAA